MSCFVCNTALKIRWFFNAVRRFFWRAPDFIIGEPPYMLRWWAIPKNKLFNIYIHKFMRSDDDRALHDHPWAFNISILIWGTYIEHFPVNPKQYGKPVYLDWESTKDWETQVKVRSAPAIVFRRGAVPHRVQLLTRTKSDGERFEVPVRTIFITGAHVREWGFYCKQGWKIWKDYVSNKNGKSVVGAGCDE